jgi:2Fe-2S ferredoxin
MAICRVTFEPVGVTVEYDPADPPRGGHGLPGSLLDIALAHGVRIEHACGGVGACGTCHVVVEAGAGHLSEPTDEELDRVECAPGNTPDSRLACLAVVSGDVTVTIPSWNRNAAGERGG